MGKNLLMPYALSDEATMALYATCAFGEWKAIALLTEQMAIIQATAKYSCSHLS
ncbi:hypothetical protein I8748_08615 [Nostoc sp. CENA67]|uniref:Uncharacterized protein n=1 Tax=Amazonocrinis nigriterrae CENA67 TaxID=2794033 RepID=A0A8J7LA60_9NOST|nr:hypothetical protein [Amazonocrinis nigriterrae]MBH8562236.1 hypothetical protein [Amazonocrinis nigriterrae CENA67]